MRLRLANRNIKCKFLLILCQGARRASDLLIRRGKKNSRIARIDAKRRRTVGDRFIVNSLRLEKIRGADELWLGRPNADMPKRSQTVRLDSEVAEQLQSFAARNSESVNDAVQRLLRSR